MTSTKSKTTWRGAEKKKQQLIEPYRDKLGTMPDAEIAALAGLHVRVIRRFRIREGFAKWDGRSRRRTKPSPAMLRVAKHHGAVGRNSDQVVAALAGVHFSTVRRYREKHRIPSARGASSVGTIHAWSVVFTSGEKRAALGATIEDAAKRAAGAGLGDVNSIERLADLL